MRKIIATNVIILLLSGVATGTVFAQLTNDKNASKPVTPHSPPPQSPQQFQADVNKIVKDNQQSLNNEVLQIQKQGPGAQLPPEMMQSPASSEPGSPNPLTPPTPMTTPATTQPPKSNPQIAAPAPETPQAAPAPATTQPYSGFGTGTSNQGNSNSNTGNTKSGGWNMGY